MSSTSVPLWSETFSPENPSLTPCLIAPRRKRAALVILPGGGYETRVNHERYNIVRWVNSLGIHAFICDYRVAPNRHPAPLDDAQRAIRLIRHRADEWNVDPDKIGVIGFSAGGHLAGSVGNFGRDGTPDSPDPVERHSARANAVIACYAVVSGAIPSGTFQNLLGPSPAPGLVEKMSLEKTVTPANPPTFLWSTAEDDIVEVEHSLRYASALSARKVPFALHVYPKGGHGLALAGEDASVSDWTGRCANWLAELGWR